MHQYLFPFLLLLALSFTACGDNGKNPTPLSKLEMTFEDTASYQPLFYHPILPATELSAQNTAIGGYGQQLQPPMQRSIAQLLTRSYWVMEFYHDRAASIPQRKLGKGQWFQFNPDGTFRGGHWENQTHSGLWYLLFDGEKTFLTIDSNVDRLDARWDIQAVNGDEDAMGWVRTEAFGPRTPYGVSVKMIELFDPPTKAQFGVE